VLALSGLRQGGDDMHDVKSWTSWLPSWTGFGPAVLTCRTALKGVSTQSGLPSKFVGSNSCSSLKRPKKHTRGISVSACANLQRKQVMDIIDLEAHSPTNRNKGHWNSKWELCPWTRRVIGLGHLVCAWQGLSAWISKAIGYNYWLQCCRESRSVSTQRRQDMSSRHCEITLLIIILSMLKGIEIHTQP